MLSIQLAETFSRALEFTASLKRPALIAIKNAGNWKALYPDIRGRLPNIKLDPGARNPVVFGQDEAHYLRQLGPAGAAQFKKHVRQLLQDHKNIFVFEAQKIECLETNPGCIKDLVKPGRSATLYFRGAIPPNLMQFIETQADDIDFQVHSVSDTSLSVIATKMSCGILNDEFDRVAAVVTVNERRALMDMRGELFSSIAPEIEDLFFEGSFGAPKLRELARRKVATALLKATVPPFSSKSGADPIEFFKGELAWKFELHGLPITCLNEVSPNLSFVIKTKKRSSELRRPSIPLRGISLPVASHR